MVVLVYYREWGNAIADYFPGVKKIRSKSEWDDHNFSSSNTYVFIGWSWIIPSEFISCLNCYCIHPSDLPKYRGGSPIQNQIIDGIELSAVTLFRMDNGLDSGPVFGKTEISLEGYLTEVFDEIIRGSIELISKFISAYERNDIVLYEQVLNDGFICKRRTPNDSVIRVEEMNKYSAKDLFNMVRCLQEPYPSLKLLFPNGSLLILNHVDYEE